LKNPPLSPQASLEGDRIDPPLISHDEARDKCSDIDIIATIELARRQLITEHLDESKLLKIAVVILNQSESLSTIDKSRIAALYVEITTGLLERHSMILSASQRNALFDFAVNLMNAHDGYGVCRYISTMRQVLNHNQWQIQRRPL
jgi:hypothetical protein